MRVKFLQDQKPWRMIKLQSGLHGTRGCRLSSLALKQC